MGRLRTRRSAGGQPSPLAAFLCAYVLIQACGESCHSRCLAASMASSTEETVPSSWSW